MQKFSHTNDDGKAQMVDVSEKPDQERIAIAKGFITLEKNTLTLIKENKIKKGDVISIARIAGIQAAKQTATLIPLCHPLPLHHIEINENIDKNGITIQSEVKSYGKTGVEMEALTAVSITLLTIYDMCKAVDKHMIIKEVKLVDKKKH